MSQQTRHANRERGSATIEAVIGVPAFLLFVRGCQRFCVSA